MNAFLKRIKACVGNPAIRVPQDVNWRIEEDQHGVVQVCVELAAQELGRNMQEDVPSAPVFALCLAYWHEKATGVPARAKVTVTGRPPGDRLALLHWRRSQFIITELRTLVPDRFECDLPDEWSWPDHPWLNTGAVERKAGSGKRKENALEMTIEKSKEFLASMQKAWPGFSEFKRQLPVGLFEGEPAKGGNWTPGGNSQVDLWGTTQDGRTLHLFELKVGGNKKVGIFSEAFYYARLLHYVRKGLASGVKIAGGGVGIDAARQAKRIVMWLNAVEYHPLIYSRSASPIEWLKEALEADNMEFRILPVSSDETHFIA